MNVLIKLVYVSWESNSERKGYFQVNSRSFNENSDMTVAEVAYQWVRDILREENISQLVEVTYNKEHDITALVKHTVNPWDDSFGDLPF